jgi:hypothetical protein
MSERDFSGMMRGWAALDSVPKELQSLLRDAAGEIDRLRQTVNALGIATVGQSFADMKANIKCEPNVTNADAR